MVTSSFPLIVFFSESYTERAKGITENMLDYLNFLNLQEIDTNLLANSDLINPFHDTHSKRK